MKRKDKAKVYHGFLMTDNNQHTWQYCDIIMEDDEILLNLHTPIVL